MLRIIHFSAMKHVHNFNTLFYNAGENESIAVLRLKRQACMQKSIETKL